MRSWDRWLPVGTVAIFVIAGAIAYSTGTTLGIPAGDLDRATVLYTDIGISMTAGIFAIIISLSLVAIQFAAQEYSHRIIEYYLRSVIFWTTLVVYLALIAAAIALQAAAGPADDVRLTMLVVVGSFLALTLLIPHFLITAAYLKPEFIVSKLAARVTASYLASRPAQGEPAAHDRLLPIVEIVERAIDKGDLTTTRGALALVQESYLERGLPCANEDVDRYYANALTRITRKAITSQDDSQSAVMCIDALGEVGQRRSASLVLGVLGDLCVLALRRDAEEAVSAGISAQAQVAQAHEADQWAAVMETFAELARRMSPDDHQRLLRELMTHLSGWFSQTESVDETLAAQAIVIFEEIGHAAAVKQVRSVLRQAVRSLAEAGKSAERLSTAESCRDAILRVERAIDRGDRESLSVAAFARGDVEASLKQQGTKAALLDHPDANPAPTGEDDADPLGLWGKLEG